MDKESPEEKWFHLSCPVCEFRDTTPAECVLTWECPNCLGKKLRQPFSMGECASIFEKWDQDDKQPQDLAWALMSMAKHIENHSIYDNPKAH